MYVTHGRQGRHGADSAPTIEGRQTYALSYAFDYGASDGGEFSVYATGADTGEKATRWESSTSSVSPSSFIFELDKKLNGG